ncbi:hypothetical protein GGI42DRAFT_113371 [Trichoderma sp. SZMC 28013]
MHPQDGSFFFLFFFCFFSSHEALPQSGITRCGIRSSRVSVSVSVRPGTEQVSTPCRQSNTGNTFQVPVESTELCGCQGTPRVHAHRRDSVPYLTGQESRSVDT